MNRGMLIDRKKKKKWNGQKLQLNKETLLSTILQLKYKHFVTENFYATEKTFLVHFLKSSYVLEAKKECNKLEVA